MAASYSRSSIQGITKPATTMEPQQLKNLMDRRRKIKQTITNQTIAEVEEMEAAEAKVKRKTGSQDAMEAEANKDAEADAGN